MKEQDEVDHLFKSTFDDFAVAPPAAAKESIDLSIAKMKKKRFYWWFFPGLALVLFVFVTGISLLDNDRQLAGQKDGSLENPQVESGKVENREEKGQVDSHSSDETKTGKSAKSRNVAAKASDVINQSKGKAGNAVENKRGKSRNSVSGKGRKNFNPAGSTKASASGSERTTPSRRQTQNKDRKNTLTPQSLASGNSISQSSEGNTALNAETPKGNGNASSTGNPTKVDEPASKATENKTAPVDKKDSSTVQVQDSSSVTEAEPVEPEKKKPQPHPFLLSLRGGANLGFNQLKSTDTTARSLKEKSGFFVQGEVSYFFQQNMALTSGLNYEQRTELLNQTVSVADSAIVDYNVQYIFDSLQQVVDSIMTPVYGVQYVPATMQNSYKVYAVSLPVMFLYSLEFSEKLNLDLSAGGIVSIQGSKIVNQAFDQATIVNKFGVKACLRGQLRYQFSAWGVSLNTNFGYDLIPVSTWGNDKRKRTYLDLGVGMHYLIGD